MANDSCIDVLKQGFYETHIDTKTDDHDADYKRYFSSDSFRSDFKNGKYKLGIGAIIDGAPFNLNYGSDDSSINTFQQKIRDSQNFNLSDHFFLESVHSLPNKDVLNAYRDCQRKHGLGFTIDWEATENTITFMVHYSNLDVGKLPKFESARIIPSGRLVFQSIMQGTDILNNSEARFVFNIKKDAEEVVFILDTDLTAISEKATIKKKSRGSDGAPIGTIITSYLNWDQFQNATDNNKEAGGIWKSEFSYWSPCDGREIPNSKYEQLSSTNRVPDLRGLFIRGLNSFDPRNEPNHVDPLHADPDIKRTAGSFQDCAIQAHSHPFVAAVTAGPYRTTGGYCAEAPTASTTGSTGGPETRPKNVAVFYYVRIN